MASLPHLRDRTATVDERALNQATLPVRDQVQDRKEQTVSSGRSTVSRIDGSERGDLEKKDAYTTTEDTEAVQANALLGVEKRKELALSLAAFIARVLKQCGKPKMAVELQLLKRELSRCHKVLAPFPSEANFLSIVVLVEAELGARSWRSITRDELLALKRALEVGEKQDLVLFDDFNRQLRTLNASGYRTGPEFEYDDGEERSAPDE